MKVGRGVSRGETRKIGKGGGVRGDVVVREEGKEKEGRDLNHGSMCINNGAMTGF